MPWLSPLHHGAESPENANFVQRFIDSDLGTFTGSFLHSVGALAFTAGIIGFILVARALRRGEKGHAAALSMLPFAQGFTVLGIGFNGAGGLMRLFQSDHPGLEQLGTSLWVQVLVVKHLFLLAGVGLALWVTWRTLTWGDVEESPAPVRMSPNRITTFALASFAAILMATVLGAVAAQTALPGETAEPLATTDGTGMEHEDAALPPLLTYASSGRVTATPAQPAEQSALLFYVPHNTTRIDVTLSWGSQVSVLDLEMASESGAIESTNRSDTATSVRLAFEPGPPMGNWTATVRSERAANEPYTVRVLVYVAQAGAELLEGDVTLLPGGTVSFFEINLEMKKGERFEYTWEAQADGVEVYFNLHTHRGGDVQYPEEGYFAEHTGEYVQDEDGGISLMWENRNANAPNPQPVEVHYRIVGQFVVDSVFGPA